MITLILFLIQFIDVLDFMVVMPLGPDLAKDLAVGTVKLGWLASAYMYAAAISGIALAPYLDLFNRKTAMLISLFGLMLSNIISGFATDFNILLLSRALAGVFGGPATSLCFAIVADLFTPERRGEIMGKVMSGFSAAAIVGVPLSLKLAMDFGWRFSFYFVAILIAITLLLIIKFLPKIDLHKQNQVINKIPYLVLLKNNKYSFAFLSVALGSIASFMIIPYISPFILNNLHDSRSTINNVYLIGGVLSFVAMRVMGKYIDRSSSFNALQISNLLIFFTLILGFCLKFSFLDVTIIFAPFMIGMAIRNVASFTLYSKVPIAEERAGFMSVLSCIQHLSSASGAFFASIILTENLDKSLANINYVILIAAILFILTPLIIKKLEAKIT